jgi:hypothetical protein
MSTMPRDPAFPASTPGGGAGECTALPAEPLADARGPIPAFGPRALDAQGRLIPLSAEERRARAEAAMRAIQALRELPDDDPPDTSVRLMRGLDEHRPPGRKLFEGMI